MARRYGPARRCRGAAVLVSNEPAPGDWPGVTTAIRRKRHRSDRQPCWRTGPRQKTQCPVADLNDPWGVGPARRRAWRQPVDLRRMASTTQWVIVTSTCAPVVLWTEWPPVIARPAHGRGTVHEHHPEPDDHRSHPPCAYIAVAFGISRAERGSVEYSRHRPAGVTSSLQPSPRPADVISVWSRKRSATRFDKVAIIAGPASLSGGRRSEPDRRSKRNTSASSGGQD